MLSRKFFISCLFSFAVLFIANDAKAFSINGQNFNKLLTVYTANSLGYWPGPQKYFSFIGDDDYIVPDNVHATTFRDSSLAGVIFSQVFTMGSTTAPGTVTGSNLTTSLNSGNVILYGPGKQVLLSATYANTGNLNTVMKPGYAGQLNVTGIYNVTGGSLFSSGLVTGSLYIDIAFDYVWQNKYKDLKTAIGTYTFYQGVGIPPPPPPPNPIPEPASIALLGGSLLGLARKRRKGKV